MCEKASEVNEDRTRDENEQMDPPAETVQNSYSPSKAGQSGPVKTRVYDEMKSSSQ